MLDRYTYDDSGEHDPRDPILIPGVHATSIEVDFTYEVIYKRIRPCYQGPILLVGSRTEGHWISMKRFITAWNDFIDDDDLMHWFNLVNQLTKDLDLYRGNIPSVVEHLPLNTPPPVLTFLQSTYGVPGSDIDLLLSDTIGHLPKGLQRIHGQYETGQVVDLFHG